MSENDTSLDRLRFRILERRVDASAYTSEYLEWTYAVDELNKTLHLPRQFEEDGDENEEEEGNTLSIRKKYDLGLIDEDEYYKQASNEGPKLPKRPEHDWMFTPSVLDLDLVIGFLQYPRNPEHTVVSTPSGYYVYDIPMMEFYEIMLDYRQRKHGKRDLIEILSKIKESSSFDEGEDICQ